ncbi:hypothetical protein ACFV4P_34310 [Kitasatospora sp. NPDC059795]|uniref:hypothetical protein n=1 Tax=Kitasatospora sp. NPDC059795 TaxID=3346949 RepID=UPI00364FBF33
MSSRQDKPRTCAYPECDVVLPVPKTGRPRKTCSDAHRSAKYRRNKAAEQTTTAHPAAPESTEPITQEPLPDSQHNVLLFGETIHRSAANFVQALTDGRDPDQALATLRRTVPVFTKRLLDQATAAHREALGLPNPAALDAQEARETAERIPAAQTDPDRTAFVTTRHETPVEPQITIPWPARTQRSVPVPPTPRDRFGPAPTTIDLTDDLGPGWTLVGWPDHPDVYYVCVHNLAAGWIERGIAGQTRWAVVYGGTYLTDRFQQPLLHTTPALAAREVQAYFHRRQREVRAQSRGGTATP